MTRLSSGSGPKSELNFESLPALSSVSGSDPELPADRTLPVVVITKVDRRRVPAQTESWLVSPAELAARHVGLAHVVSLSQDMTFVLTERVGRPWSAWGGAVRVFWPGTSFDDDVPALHPLTTPERIVFWRHDELAGVEAFRTFLGESLFSFAATKRQDWRGLKFMTDARSLAAKSARSVARDVEGGRDEYERQIEALSDRLVELEAEAERYNDDAMESDRVKEIYRGENADLRLQVEALRARLAEKLGHDPDETIEIPADYDALPEWVSRHLAGRLVLHPRALQGLKGATYEDVALVYKALLALANEYRNMRLGFEGAKDRWDRLLETLGLRFGGSISEANAGKEGAEYYVQYPLGTMRRQFLASHLRKGTTKDDRYCLAIYFFWDDETRQVVVGWLPGHLENRLT